MYFTAFYPSNKSHYTLIRNTKIGTSKICQKSTSSKNKWTWKSKYTQKMLVNSRKFYIRSNNKVDSMETRVIVMAHLLP